MIRMKATVSSRQVCPEFQHAVELIGRRWTGSVLYLLLAGPAGYAELRGGIPGITDRMLCERLRELESEEIVSRTVLGGAPVRVRYALTRKGRSLAGVMERIARWGEAWVAPSAKRPSSRVR